MAEDVAAVPAGDIGSPKYAEAVAPERRRTGDGDYNKVVSNHASAPPGEERKHSDVEAGVKQVGKPKDEMADSDDSDAAKNFLMQAWQALVMYVSSCDDEDQQAALQALKMVTNLMNDVDEPNQPATTGAFNVTSMAKSDKAAQTFSCPQDNRTFGTEAGLINHLKTVHVAREHQNRLTQET